MNKIENIKDIVMIPVTHILHNNIIKFPLDKRYRNHLLYKIVELIGEQSIINSKESSFKKGLKVIKQKYKTDTGKDISIARIKMLYKDFRFLSGYKLCCPVEITNILKSIISIIELKELKGVSKILDLFVQNHKEKNCVDIFIPKHSSFICEFDLNSLDKNKINTVRDALASFEHENCNKKLIYES